MSVDDPAGQREEAGIEVPDLLEPIVACRSWTVNKEGPVPGDESVYQSIDPVDKPWHLWSTAQTAVCWDVGINTAYCVTESGRRGTKGHVSVPYEGCMCGLYALGTWEQLFQEHPALRPRTRENSFRVYGTVNLTGKVIPAKNGYRAAKAEVRSLLLPSFEPYGDRAEKREMVKQLKSMQRVVRATAQTYGVPVVTKLEELTPPFVIPASKEDEDEHRGGVSSHRGGTTTGPLTSPATWYTTTNPFYTSTGTNQGTSSSLTVADLATVLEVVRAEITESQGKVYRNLTS